MINPVIIIGAKETGLLALDVFKSNDIVVYGFLEEDKTFHGMELGEVTVLGSPENEGFTKLIGKKCDAFIASDDVKWKKFWVDFLIESRKVMPVNTVHKTANISPYAELGHGNLVGSFASVGAFCKVGNFSNFYSGANLGVATKIGDYSEIGSGAVVGNNVSIGKECFIGPGAVIVAGLSIGDGASVGAGSVVVENVPARTRYFGNPAKKV